MIYQILIVQSKSSWKRIFYANCLIQEYLLFLLILAELHHSSDHQCILYISRIWMLSLAFHKMLFAKGQSRAQTSGLRQTRFPSSDQREGHHLVDMVQRPFQCPVGQVHFDVINFLFYTYQIAFSNTRCSWWSAQSFLRFSKPVHWLIYRPRFCVLSRDAYHNQSVWAFSSRFNPSF